MFGDTIIQLAHTSSTNTYLASLLASKPIEGTVVWAQEQTAGRGASGTIWDSVPHKDLMLSVLLYPHFLAPEQMFYLNICVSLALTETLTFWLGSLAAECKIKWPNDILIEHKKVCGILIENQLMGGRIESSIVGIGINVNRDTFPNDLEARATSLYLYTQQIFDLESVLQRLLHCLHHYYTLLKTGQKEILFQSYLNQLYQLNIWASYYRSNGSMLNGKIIGVSPIGRLKMQIQATDDYSENHSTEEFDYKEIIYS